MRNLKKVLALALALVMTLSVLSIASAAFTDEEDINPNYQEAVDVLAALGVFQGRDDGSFDPQATITRAEVAAIIYRISTGDVNDEQVGLYADYNKFEDVSSDQWFAGYVNYCANATYIKGRSDTIFDPDADVTGYEVLAMILRVVGYDQNDEWTGTGWEIKVASTANELGVTDGIKGTTLGSAVSREVVAQMLFAAIQVPCVTYTPAFGYNQNTTILGSEQNDSIGYKTFKLVGTYTDDDAWGRPSNDWKLDKNGNKDADASDTTLLSYSYEPAAIYTTMVDECDIAADIGLNATRTIEAAYIDGYSVDTKSTDVTSNGVGSINPLAVTSVVGGQGRITEVYIMSTGIRLVEINTYLAQVTDVEKAVTDKNGHTGVPSTEFTIYVGFDEDGEEVTVTGTYATDAYAKNSYVLVTMKWDGDAESTPVIRTIEAAEIGTVGDISWTNETAPDPNTTTVGDETYNDADKFVVGYRSDVELAPILDDYGNIIGLVEVSAAADTYLVIEKIEWQNITGTIGEGYVLADVILGDGTEVKNVVVSKINDIDVYDDDVNFGDDTEAYGNVSDNYKNNDEYYGHIYIYTVDKDGNYCLTTHDADSNIFVDEESSASVTNGKATINGKTNTVVATNSTIFLIQNKDGYTYTVYVGKNNVPTGTAENMCALLDKNGYATMVVLTGFKEEGETDSFYAYVTDNTVYGVSSNKGNAYHVYAIGETASTTVYQKYDAEATDSFEALYTRNGTGIYKFTLSSSNVIQSCEYVIGDLQYEDSYECESDAYVRVAVAAAAKGASIQTAKYKYEEGTVTVGVAYKDYGIAEDAAIILVTKTAADATGTATLEAITISDVKANDIVIIGYNSKDADLATVIYVIRVAETEESDENDGTTKLNESPITLTGMTYCSDFSEYAELMNDENLDGEGFVITAVLDEGYEIKEGSYLSVEIKLGSGQSATLIVSTEVGATADIIGGEEFYIFVPNDTFEEVVEIVTGSYTATVSIYGDETTKAVTASFNLIVTAEPD